jgi:hypothetical protein
LAPLLNGHAAGYFRHRDQERQLPVGGFHRFIGQADRTAADHGVGKFFAGGKMEIRENELAGPAPFVLCSNRFFYFHDHFRLHPYLIGGGQYMRPVVDVFLINKAAAIPGGALHVYFVPPAGQFQCAGWCERHAIFVTLDFLWYANNHKRLILVGKMFHQKSAQRYVKGFYGFRVSGLEVGGCGFDKIKKGTRLFASPEFLQF